MNFLKKAIPAWLTIAGANAISISLVVPNSKVEEPKSMLNVILAKPPTKKAERPKKIEDRKINRDNYYKCLQRASESICRSKHYWGN